MRPFRPILAAVAACAVVALPVAAQQDPLQNAISARKAQMRLHSHNLGVLGPMAQGAVAYDAAVALRAARNLDALAGIDQTSYWIEGSLGIEGTRAMPAILEDAAGFAAQQAAFKAATTALVAAAGTDLAGLQGAMGAVGAVCGSCHEGYRAD
jgi:cytochrome c556